MANLTLWCSFFFSFLLKMNCFLFFFPSVEKAALVFSLKLDNGHKLLCPWIDNACDEALADFPPTPAPILVNKFRERCSMLLHLSALPVISSSFLKWMKSSHLKQFLEELSLKEFGNESLNNSEIEFLGDGHDSDTAKVYYQVLLLLHQYLHMLIPVMFTNLLRSCSSFPFLLFPTFANLSKLGFVFLVKYRTNTGNKIRLLAFSIKCNRFSFSLILHRSSLSGSQQNEQTLKYCRL